MPLHRLPSLHNPMALLLLSLLCSAQAQITPTVPAPKPAPVATTPAPAVPVPEPPPPAPITPVQPPPMHRPMPETLSPAEQFSQALNNRDVAKATSLLQADPTLAKTLLPDGTSPLVMALRNYYGDDNGGKSLVQLLLDNGADVNKADRSGTTPLQATLTRGSDSRVYDASAA